VNNFDQRFTEDSFMSRIPLLKDDFEDFKVPAQVDSLSDSSVNHALTYVAQEVARLLQHAYPV
jgi:hypothetical protein